MAAHNNEVLNELPNAISVVQKSLPNVSFMVNPDHVNMTEILPGFLQHVTIPTSWTVFIPTNKMPTEPSLAPHRGPLQPRVHHTCCFLRALLTSFRPTQKIIAVRPSGAVSALQGCFHLQTVRSSGSQLHLGFFGGGGVLEEYSHTSPSALRTWPPPGLFPGYPNLETLAECKDLLPAESKGWCVQGHRRFGTQRARAEYTQKTQGHFSCLRSRTVLFVFIASQTAQRMPPPLWFMQASPIWSGRAPTFICSSHAAVCTRPFGHWASTSVFYTLIFGQHNWTDTAATPTMLLRMLT